MKNGIELDYQLFDLDKSFPEKYSVIESSVVAPPNIVIAPFHNGIPK